MRRGGGAAAGIPSRGEVPFRAGLLVTQRGGRIDAQPPHGCGGCRDEADGPHDGHDRCQHDRVSRPHLVEQGRDGPAQGQRAGELHLIVEDVTADNVRLRLEGFARLGAPFDPRKANDLKGPFGYEPRLTGFLHYDTKHKRITRLEILAIGDTYGYPNTHDPSWRPAWRPGRQPLAVAFEMVSGTAPADRIPAKVVP